ncbi:hypothetical protein BOTBODRAFT_169366 [Botryobasidium botryosum FD-172 SS1]|uniref:L-lactate dehydrogenase (cytochrome) n=1 Tax=Botryobasidium botryosum (strain FD-172 SS1) TaxID=930990 RepID=A0A067N104_BOTB1|nr:hypothetical protein BOTBODRAFT_169366 [Botryobasidium botryosum FD-172 SS1]
MISLRTPRLWATKAARGRADAVVRANQRVFSINRGPSSTTSARRSNHTTASTDSNDGPTLGSSNPRGDGSGTSERAMTISAAVGLSAAAIAYFWSNLRALASDAPGKEELQANAAAPGKGKFISYQEVQKHNKPGDCWIIVKGKVYDVTDFLKSHPGGLGVILANSGQDATAVYERFHTTTFLQTILKPENHLGPVDPESMPEKTLVKTDEERRIEEARKNMPPLGAMVNLNDIEESAKKVLSSTAWGYYASSSETENSHLNNLASFKRYWFRPRVLREVGQVDMSATFLGIPTSLPIFVCPAAMAGLGHPLGEVNITRGAGRTGIIQGISSNASCTVDEVAEARTEGQPLVYQLYLTKDRAVSERMVKRIEELGFRAIMFTVDAPVLGKRELDMKSKPVASETGGGNVAGSLAGYFDVNIGWKDVVWLRSITKLPIILKGIQTVEDVEIAADYGVDGVLLSNHGGRQLDFAPAAIDVLYELRQKRPDLMDKMEIYLDGGVRRGTDVLKALCLGAKGVGLGRPFLFANGAYGEEGVVRVVQILEEEIGIGMRLLGVRSLGELRPEMVQAIDARVHNKPQ